MGADNPKPMGAATRLARATDGFLRRSHSFGALPGAPVASRASEVRVNVPLDGCDHPSGLVELAPIDMMSLRRTISTHFVFDQLLDLDALQAGLER